MRTLRRRPLLASVAGAALFSAAPAWAQDEPDGAAASEDAENGAIVVLGNRLEESQPEEIEKYGSRLEEISGEDIDQAGFVDTGQALQMLVPGLYVAPKNGAFDYVNVSLLGSRTKDLLFLVDGVRISNRLYASTTPLDSIPANMIERIEVLKGGQGLYYGTQAVGGVINVVTKAFTGETDGAVEAGYDTNEGYHFNGYVRDGFGDHYFVGFASYDEAEGFQPFHDADYQPSATDRNRGYKVVSVGGKYAFEPSEEFRFSASYQHIDGRVDFAQAEDVFQNWNERNEEIASVKVDWTPSDRFSFFAKGYWHDWDSTYHQLYNNLGPSGLPDGTITTIFDGEMWGFEDRGINVLGEYRVTDAITLVGGYDFQKYNGYDEVFLIAPTSEEVHAPFAQLRFDSGRLSLAAGVRHNMPSDGQAKTVWNLSGRLGLNDAVYVRGQVGTSFRLPDAYELYVIDPCCERGNPNLIGEESFNTEVGIGLERGMFSGEVLGFYRKIENLIDIDFSLPAFPDGFIVNTDEHVTAWGGEVIVNARFSEVLSATFDYTHTEVEASGTNQQVQDIPRDLAKLILRAEAPSGRFGGAAAVNWVGDVFDQVGGGVGRVEHGNYAVVDLSAYAFLDEGQRHRLGVRLENALDADYATRITRVRRDIIGTSYGAENRGTPFTLHATYRLSL
jgi:outer membrane cobalamin receptor